MNALQIANSFVVEYFERLATNPAELVPFYGPHATLTINDIEMGITEVNGDAVPFTLQQWTAILEDSKLRIESVNAASLYNGVNVFVTFTANSSTLQQHFQFTFTLEAYPNGFSAEGYYIRHQVISRIGVLTHDAADADDFSQSAVNEEQEQNDEHENVGNAESEDNNEDSYKENEEEDAIINDSSAQQAEMENVNKVDVSHGHTDSHDAAKSESSKHTKLNKPNKKNDESTHDKNVNRESVTETADTATSAAHNSAGNAKDEAKEEEDKHEAGCEEKEQEEQEQEEEEKAKAGQKGGEGAANENEKTSSAQPPQPTKIKSWASLASTAAHKSAAPTRVVRVVASETATRKDDENKSRNSNTTTTATATTALPAVTSTSVKSHNNSNKENNTHSTTVHSTNASSTTTAAAAAAAANGISNGTAPTTASGNKANGAREVVRRDRRPQDTVGDRLMFSIDFPITDDEIKAAMGAVSASLISLRNNSDKGHVFMDFAANVRAFDVIKRANMTFGPNKTRVNVYRQRSRE